MHVNGAVSCAEKKLGRLWEEREGFRKRVGVLEWRMGHMVRAREMLVDMGQIRSSGSDMSRGSSVTPGSRGVFRRKWLGKEARSLLKRRRCCIEVERESSVVGRH